MNHLSVHYKFTSNNLNRTSQIRNDHCQGHCLSSAPELTPASPINVTFSWLMGFLFFSICHCLSSLSRMFFSETQTWKQLSIFFDTCYDKTDVFFVNVASNWHVSGCIMHCFSEMNWFSLIQWSIIFWYILGLNIKQFYVLVLWTSKLVIYLSEKNLCCSSISENMERGRKSTSQLMNNINLLPFHIKLIYSLSFLDLCNSGCGKPAPAMAHLTCCLGHCFYYLISGICRERTEGKFFSWRNNIPHCLPRCFTILDLGSSIWILIFSDCCWT